MGALCKNGMGVCTGWCENSTYATLVQVYMCVHMHASWRIEKFLWDTDWKYIVCPFREALIIVFCLSLAGFTKLIAIG